MINGDNEGLMVQENVRIPFQGKVLDKKQLEDKILAVGGINI